VKRYIFLGFVSTSFLVGNSAHAQDSNSVISKTESAPQTTSQLQTADPPGWIVPYLGVDFAPGSWFTYAGVVLAPNGNLAEPGVVIRSFGGYGEFKYNNPTVSAQRIHGSISMADAMVGYQTFGEYYRVAGYVGIENQNIHLSPADPTAKVDGEKTGVKFLGEFETNNRTPFYLNAMASYSTAFDSYWIRLRPGYRTSSFIFGPEVAFQGNRGGDSQRIGGFISLERPIGRGNYFGITAATGYTLGGKSNPSISGGTHNGVYGSLLVYLFF
jgi:hypothetical protein